MSMRSIGFAVLALSVPSVAAAQEAARWNLAFALQRMRDDRWFARPPMAGERAVQCSSFDRRSLEGPANQDAWYANDDRGKYVRTVERDGRTEHVLCEAKGPGLVTRIWSANPSGTLCVDVDGQRVWEVDFAALCGGRVAGLGEPFCGMRARGGNCYLPMPFAKSLVVACTAGDLYYHVDVLHLPEGTEVVPFAPARIEAARDEFAATAARLARPELGFASASGLGSSMEIPPGKVVSWFSVAVPEAPKGTSLGDLLRQCLLVVRCGKEETVRVPVLDFFAGGSDWRAHGGRYLEVRADRTAVCALPMPMPEGGLVRIVNRTGRDDFRPELQGLGYAAHAAESDDLLFRASFHVRKGFASRPFHDHLVLDSKGGAGRFVGCSLLVKNPHRAWWGEGDEKFTVDGEAFPSTFGTGTEDYFGYAWCDPTVFQSALHGQVQCDGPVNRGFTSVHRFHLLDAVPFQSSFRFDLEVWHWVPDLAMDYATVAYWYGAKGSAHGLPPLPEREHLALDPLPPVRVRKVAGAFEAEGLAVARCTGGTHSVQETWFVEELCSEDAQLWWMDGAVGDELSLRLPAVAAGRYRVFVGFVRAKDYGIVQCALDGVALGEPHDLYAKDIGHTGEVLLGEVEFAAGAPTFSLRLTGQNRAAEPRRMVGLDTVRLEVVR